MNLNKPLFERGEKQRDISSTERHKTGWSCPRLGLPDKFIEVQRLTKGLELWGLIRMGGLIYKSIYKTVNGNFSGLQQIQRSFYPKLKYF